MSELIIGLTGSIASGKGTVKKYIVEKYGAKDCRFSTILRDVLDRINIPTSRDNLINVSTVLRQTFGEDLLAKAIAKDAASLEAKIVIIDGIRRMTDIGHLMNLDHFILVSVDADAKIRYERLVLRNENEGDGKKTFEDFLNDHKRETEITIPEVMSFAKEKINNDGTLDDLFAQIDKLIGKYLNK
jgi:dephospho-CoA kinase